MIKLELSVADVNTILRVLGKHPFEEVITLIQTIKKQGDPQAEEMAKEVEAKAAAELPAA
jgi:hypothetical protein